MAYEGDFGSTLLSLLAFDGGFGSTLGSLWEHLRHMEVTLGPLWGHFGVSLAPVLVSVGDFASLDGHFAIIMESLWVYESPIQKTFVYPTDFNDFIKLLGEVLVDLGLLWDHFWHMKVAWGPL